MWGVLIMDGITVGLIGLVCSVVGAILGIVAAVKTAETTARNTEKELTECTKEDTRHLTRLETKIDYAARGIDDIKLDNKESSRELNKLNERVIRTEESTKSAHNRINAIEERIGV